MEQSPLNNKNLDWKEFHEKIARKEPSSFLVKTVTEYCKDKGPALDIAAGNLRDSKYLLSQGFSVTAVDPSLATVEYANELNNQNLTVVQEILGNYPMPENHFSIINAQDILFHFQPKLFNMAIERIKNGLKVGGIFCGDFLGVQDDWNYSGTKKTILEIEQVKELFHDFEIKEIREVVRDENEEAMKFKGNDKPKHWHFIHIIAQKK